MPAFLDDTLVCCHPCRVHLEKRETREQPEMRDTQVPLVPRDPLGHLELGYEYVHEFQAMGLREAWAYSGVK